MNQCRNVLISPSLQSREPDILPKFLSTKRLPFIPPEWSHKSEAAHFQLLSAYCADTSIYQVQVFFFFLHQLVIGDTPLRVAGSKDDKAAEANNWGSELPVHTLYTRTNLNSILQSRNITLPIKVHLAKAMVFPVVYVWMWDLDHKEDWVPKNWCFQIVVLKKTLESSLCCKEIKLVNPKGNQLWIFIGRTDAEAEDPIFWPPDVKSQLIGKDSDVGKDWGQEEKGVAKGELVR